MESEERHDSQVHFSILKEDREEESDGEGEIKGNDCSDTEQSASELFMASLLCKGRWTNVSSIGTNSVRPKVAYQNSADHVLLHPTDPANRLTLERAAMHTYLLYGQSPRDGPPLMDPLTLHQSTPPVALPVRSKDGTAAGEADGQDEHLWARRQFSVLWAPMPSDGTAVKQHAVCNTFHYLVLHLNSHASVLPQRPVPVFSVLS